MYAWLKAFHLIFMVTWFAGLFYLPRLFVYHAMADDEVGRERFKVMERKLYAGIMTPSLVLLVMMGAGLIAVWGMAWFKASTWLHVKLALVAVLIGYHFYLGRLVQRFKADQNRHTHVFYRWINEFPVLILVAVIILAVLKPWHVSP